MVESGRGTQNAEFQDINRGKSFWVNTQARIYLSYFDPAGLGAMGPTPPAWRPGSLCW